MSDVDFENQERIDISPTNLMSTYKSLKKIYLIKRRRKITSLDWFYC